MATILFLLTGAGWAEADHKTEERLSKTRDRLAGLAEREAVLTQTIASYGRRVVTLRGQVATKRNREARVRDELSVVRVELTDSRAVLDQGKERLRRIRQRLQRAISVLEQRLVAIYKSNEPNVLTVLLQSDGYEDLLERSEYLRRIETADSTLVERVRNLRAQVDRVVARRKAAVGQIESQREAVAIRRDRLRRSRVGLQAREVRLTGAEERREGALGVVEGQQRQLERIEAGLEERVQAQLAAASPGPPLPAGPVQKGSGDMIWPVDGTISSPFGPRWGRLHAGLDISAPAGTPIRAAKAGSVVLASPYGGYGNYTCLSHGGGLSTCYAHQQSFATSRGAQVDQGEVIGYVGNTGNSFGNHLHFEVRVDGVPQDPLGYL